MSKRRKPRKRKRRSTQEEKRDPQTTAPQSKLDALLFEVHSLHQRGSFPEALDLLQQAPEALKARWEHLFSLGLTYLGLEDDLNAIRAFERCTRLDASQPEPHFLLAHLYTEMGLFGLALDEARRYLKLKPGDPQDEERMGELASFVSESLAITAEAYGVPPSRLKSAALKDDQGQRSLHDGRFSAGVGLFDQAIRFAPHWPAPRNNRSLALFRSGRPRQAIAEAETVLSELDPENTHAAANLIQFQVCMGKREQAERYAALLRGRKIDEVDDLTKAIEGLGYLAEDEALWQMAHQVLENKPHPTELQGDSLYLLGAAAANTGRLQEAKRLFQNAMDTCFMPERVERALKALELAQERPHGEGHKPLGPSLDGRFPYIHFSEIIPKQLFDEFDQLLDQATDIPQASLRRRMVRLVERFPQLIFAATKMIWDEGMTGLGLDMLVNLGTPRAYEELRRFASSKHGSAEARSQAWMRLSTAGQLKPGEAPCFWDSELEIWTQAILHTWEVRPDEPHPNTEVQALLEHALSAIKEHEWDAAGAALHHALTLDPSCAESARLLGVVTLSQDIDSDEGEHWLRRAVEIEPDYYLGSATLASHLIRTGRREEARDWLGNFYEAEWVPFSALVAQLTASTELAIAEGQFEVAESYIQTLEEHIPGSPKVGVLTSILSQARSYHEYWLRDVHRYHLRARSKPIKPDEALSQCLARLTVETLKATCRAWSCSTAGRKAQVIDRLTKSMKSPGSLEWQVGQLAPREHDALRMLLEQGGVLSWQSFVDTFGEEIDASPYWQYHHPETVPGNLRMLGLLAVGTYDKEVVGVIPFELRQSIARLLADFQAP